LYLVSFNISKRTLFRFERSCFIAETTVSALNEITEHSLRNPTIAVCYAQSKEAKPCCYKKVILKIVFWRGKKIFSVFKGCVINNEGFFDLRCGII